VEPKEPSERTRESYRFAVPVAAGKNGRLSVVEMRMVEQGVALGNLPSDRIELYVRNSAVSPAVRGALQKLLDLKGKLSDTVDQRARLEARVSDIAKDQERIRSNMDRLSQGSDLYKKYVKTLTDQEEELAKLRDDIAKLRDQESARRRDVDAHILSIEVK
jgi:chromosome segregation ATPase